MALNDPALEIFHQAQQSFRSQLNDPNLYNEILASNSIDEVYNLTAKLQEEAAGKAGLRNLARIRPFLERLSSYSAVIEVLLQVKPELALIWGPIKLLLQLSSQLTSAFDRVADTMVKVGYALPQFAMALSVFEWSDAIRAAMALFYGDLLEFYRVNLDFFRKRRWKQMFEAIWPSYQKKLDVVVSNIELHATLIRNEVTLLDVSEAQQARVKSLEQFSEMQRSHSRQRFTGLKGQVAPFLFDDRLDWIRNRSVAGCAKWLFRDAAFSEWFDVSTQAPQYLWLQGMPGAGKTYLCAAAVGRARERHRVLFALVSHAAKKTTTALGVLQSMIFQAAEEDHDLQAILLEAKERELRGNTLYVTELLKAYLKTASQMYIMIDGLDEMDEHERQVLLERLEEIAKECRDLRILISCRPEGDISRKLEKNAFAIKVNDRNAGSIQHYVDHRAHDWISSLGCSPSMETELRGLLSPLAAKAAGMFLYARIVLDNLQGIVSLDDIRRELKALPEDLNDAYHRILQRISDLPTRKRERSRKILGWIGCAPIPLTVWEMEQALSVEFDENGRMTSAVTPDLVSVNFVQLCGPIIEVADGKLQFVHFTVEVYLFSPRILHYIDKHVATLDLVNSLMAYLTSGIVDLDLDEGDIQEQTRHGRFRLFDYASFYWPVLLHDIISVRRETTDSRRNKLLGRLLKRVSRKLQNSDFITTEPPQGLTVGQKGSRVNDEDLDSNAIICGAKQFHSNERRWGWNMKNNESWINQDPLITSQMLIRLREQHEILLSMPDCRPDLERQYGPQLFRCTYVFCTRSRRGFASADEREQHIENHGRPLKCVVPSCEFSSIGFDSEGSRQRHWKKHHISAARETQAAVGAAAGGGGNFDALDPEEAQPLLFVLLAEENVDLVRRLLCSQAGMKLKPEVIAHARLMAAEQGSLALTELLAPVTTETKVPFKVLAAAVASEDADFSEWAYNNLSLADWPNMMKVVIKVRREDIFTRWERYIQREVDKLRIRPHHGDSLFTSLLRQSLFTEVQGNELKETRIKCLLTQFRRYMSWDILGTLLLRVARSSCSVALAEHLLRLQAPINFCSSSGRANGQTPLYVASKKTSVEAAFFMKCLILNGADTVVSINNTDTLISEEKGAAQIAEKVGLTRSDLEQMYKKRGKYI
ncbi:hypothetical protein AbraIFM66950_011525 [Aspergillus brasiliensis]|nr:hypothetical protein AbraIFM66950_011525 [Aspergillus brasiliensis]